MAERRKGARRKSSEQNQNLSKEEDCLARYVRFNCPTKTTMFEGNEVHYFTGSKAVDILFESKKYGCAAKSPKFGTRQSAVVFLRTMLEKGLFFRARKLVPKKKSEKKDTKDKTNEELNKSPKKYSKAELRAEKDGDKKKGGDSDDNGEDDEKDKKSKEKEEEDKKKRKVKLELHQDQVFNDANDVYVWIFDPTPLYKKVIGALMVMGTIAGCLFPLWPMWLRQGVYYGSIVGLFCFGLLIGVAIARTILFAIVWGLTLGKHKLWLLPNLTEDCGFFESFQPWYTYEYCPGSDSGKKKKKNGTKNESEEISNKKSDANDDLKKVEDHGDGGDGCSETHSKSGASKSSANDGQSDDSDEVSDFDNDSNQGTTDESAAVSGDNEKTNIESSTDPVRQRRRPRKADDDFVLVDP